MLNKKIRDAIKLQCKLEGVTYPICMDCDYYNYFFPMDHDDSCACGANKTTGTKARHPECDAFWMNLSDDWVVKFGPSEKIKNKILKKELEN